MSDIGLHGSIYEQLKLYADRIDRNLVHLRSKDSSVIEDSRTDLAHLLREIGSEDSTNPSTRLVNMVLKQGLSRLSGQNLKVCITLAETLEKRPPNEKELEALEKIAMIIDHECSETMARLRGRV